MCKIVEGSSEGDFWLVGATTEEGDERKKGEDGEGGLLPGVPVSVGFLPSPPGKCGVLEGEKIRPVWQERKLEKSICRFSVRCDE